MRTILLSVGSRKSLLHMSSRYSKEFSDHFDAGGARSGNVLKVSSSLRVVVIPFGRRLSKACSRIDS